MEEEISFGESEQECVLVCKCIVSEAVSTEKVSISERKQKVLTTVLRTEKYIRERHISEIIQFLFTKVITQHSNKPIAYLEKLLDDCMLYRAGHKEAPVLYEIKHLEAIIESFDPGHRGWLSAGQVRRIYATVGLNPEDFFEDRTPCHTVLSSLVKTQESKLSQLLSANIDSTKNEPFSKTNIL